jgi:hypothetical protein
VKPSRLRVARSVTIHGHGEQEDLDSDRCDASHDEERQGRIQAAPASSATGPDADQVIRKWTQDAEQKTIGARIGD